MIGPTDRIAALLPRAQELLAEGMSYREVGRTLGVSAQTIAHHFPCQSQWTPRDGGVFIASCKAAARQAGVTVTGGLG